MTCVSTEQLLVLLLLYPITGLVLSRSLGPLQQ